MTRVFLSAFALLLSGCVSVLPEARPPAPRYLLEPVSYDAPAGEMVEWSLALEDPSSTRVYDTQKIAVIREPGRVEFLANGEWADRAPRLFQAALIRSFENSGRILGVGDRTALPLSSYILFTDIRALHGDYSNGGPKAVIEVYARLADVRGKVYAAQLFSNEAEAERGSAAAVAAAFDQATERTLDEIVQWVFEEGEKGYAK